MSFTDDLWKVELEMQKKDQSRLENSIEFAQNLGNEDDENKVGMFRKKKNKKKFKKHHRSSMEIFHDPTGGDEDDYEEEDVREMISSEIKRRNSDDNSYFGHEENESYEEDDDYDSNDVVFVYRDFIHKLIIGDAYAPFTVNCLSNYPALSETKVKQYDTDTKKSNIMMSLYLGIILTRHPSAVFTKDEFRNFRQVKEYDYERFLFAADADNNVFAYDVSNTSEVINEVEKAYGFEKTLQILVAGFILSNTEANVFQYGNADYIKAYKDGINNKDFVEVFTNHPGTKITKSMEEDIVKIFTDMDVLNMEEAIESTKSTVDYLTEDEEETVDDPNDVPEEEEVEEALEPDVSESKEEDVKDTFIAAVTSSTQPKETVPTEPKVVVPPTPKKEEKEEKPSGIFYTKSKPQPAEPEEPVVEDYDPSQPLDENFDPASLAKMMQTSNKAIDKEKQEKEEQKTSGSSDGKVGTFTAFN